MSASALLQRIVSAGIELAADGDAILARGALTDEIRALIRSNKPALLEVLRSPPSPPAAANDDPLRRWRSEIDAVLPITADAEWLRGASLAFLDGELAAHALMLGWGEVQLFGVHSGQKPAVRSDAFGLIPALAFSVLGATLIAIDGDHAHVRSRGGSPLRHPRRRANHNEAVAWWRHSVLIEAV